MANNSCCKTTIFSIIGILVLAGIIIGIVAATGAFSSSSSSTSTSDSSSSTCSQCYTPSCPSISSVAAECNWTSVSITDGSGTTRLTVTGNNYPCHDMAGTSIYVLCPSTYSETLVFPVPTLCSTSEYYTGSACASFTYSSIQPYFGDVGFLGRPSTKSSHWSSSNAPIEAVSYDPLPAECGDITAHECASSYTGTKRFSVMDVSRLTAAGTTITYDDGTTMNLDLDSYNAHVQPGGSTNPSSATYGLYHYHAYPGWDDGTYADYVIGYANDGVPFMGRSSTLTSGSSATSSYSLKSGETGQYHMDYEYIANQGTLDEFNGGMATIDGTSIYAYFSTAGYPYIFRNFHGSY